MVMKENAIPDNGTDELKGEIISGFKSMRRADRGIINYLVLTLNVQYILLNSETYKGFTAMFDMIRK